MTCDSLPAAPAASDQGTQAFTLIELLVVIAIISLLVSILLPSLSRAREIARTVICQTNEHNIWLAENVYQTDYDGYFPAAYWRDDARGISRSWYRVLCNDYMNGAKGAFTCPTAPQRNGFWDQSLGYGWNYINLTFGYYMSNPWYQGKTGSGRINGDGMTQNIDSIREPDRCLMLADSGFDFPGHIEIDYCVAWWDGGMACAQFNNGVRLDYVPETRHGGVLRMDSAGLIETTGGANVCYVAGNVETLDYDTVRHRRLFLGY